MSDDEPKDMVPRFRMPKILRFRTGRQIAYAACSAVVDQGATPVHVLGDRAARAICSPEEARLLSRRLAAEVEVVVHSERVHPRLPGSSFSRRYFTAAEPRALLERHGFAAEVRGAFVGARR